MRLFFRSSARPSTRPGGIDRDDTLFGKLLRQAKAGDVLVRDVFAHLYSGAITADQCRDVIEAYELAAVPRWKRLLVAF